MLLLAANVRNSERISRQTERGQQATRSFSMTSATTAAFEGYMDDFTSARSDALRAIDAYEQCTDQGINECSLCV